MIMDLRKDFFIFILISTLGLISGELSATNKKLEWFVGRWRSEFGGKIVWPTVPTMTYGEELIVLEAPMAKSTNVQFLNFRYIYANLGIKFDMSRYS